MTLSKLLEDKRYEWQKNTQEQILSGLLHPTHRYKTHGKKDDKLIMVFGKSHAGKTTFILSLMGIVDNEKLGKLNEILRAGVPEGKSSTSTAIVYRRSDDDTYGVCEHGINDTSICDIDKCSEEKFVEKIQAIRKAVESQKRDKENVLFLYIPKFYFDEEVYNKQNISILDVPGHETTNLEERQHTEALLHKYMSISSLNIIVRSINDINDLQYFEAPNGDDATKLTTNRYIIVTTRTYSQESIFNYFKKPRDKRESSFEDILKKNCDEEFARIFGENIPKYFPLDIGKSFAELINTKLSQEDEDREYLIAYRKRVFEEIYKCIDARKNNTLLSWFKEIIEDERIYALKDLARAEERKKEMEGELERLDNALEKNKREVERLENICNEANERIQELLRKKEEVIIPDFNVWIENKAETYVREFFDEKYRWKNGVENKDASVIFAEFLSDVLKGEIERMNFEHEAVISEKLIKNWLLEVENAEVELRENLNNVLNRHTFLKFFNPSNREKVTIGKIHLKMVIPGLLSEIYMQIRQVYDAVIFQIQKYELNKFSLLKKEKIKDIEVLTKEKNTVEKEVSSLASRRMGITQRIKNDKVILEEYQKIAQEKFLVQRSEIVGFMNSCSTKEEKMKYFILLCLMEKDYKKITEG